MQKYHRIWSEWLVGRSVGWFVCATTPEITHHWANRHLTNEYVYMHVHRHHTFMCIQMEKEFFTIQFPLADLVCVRMWMYAAFFSSCIQLNKNLVAFEILHSINICKRDSTTFNQRILFSLKMKFSLFETWCDSELLFLRSTKQFRHMHLQMMMINDLQFGVDPILSKSVHRKIFLDFFRSVVLVFVSATQILEPTDTRYKILSNVRTENGFLAGPYLWTFCSWGSSLDLLFLEARCKTHRPFST